MTIKGEGPMGWILDGSVTNNAAEMICARCDREYQEIFSRLTKAIGAMIEHRDGDALMLLQKVMQLGVNEIAAYFGSKPVGVVKDA